MSNLGQGDWQAAKIFVPDGHHLRPARDASGVVRTLLFKDGTNRMVGPPVARLDPPNGDQGSIAGWAPTVDGDSTHKNELLSEILAVALIAAGAAIVEVGTPLLLDWWTNRAWPAIRFRWSEWRGKTTKAGVAPEVTSMWAVGISGKVEAAKSPAELTSMTIDEARARQIAMLTAARFLIEQYETPRNAQIADGRRAADHVGTAGAFTADQIAAGVRAILGRGQAFIDDDIATELRLLVEDLPVSPMRSRSALSTTEENDTGHTPA